MNWFCNLCEAMATKTVVFVDDGGQNNYCCSFDYDTIGRTIYCNQISVGEDVMCDPVLTENLECSKSHYPVITLCGSTRFKDTFMEVQKKLTLEGNIVLSVGVFGHSDNEEPSEEQKAMLDDIHKAKIDMADMIYVINVDGYIGKSTQSEIDYAIKRNKPIIYHEYHKI